MKKLRFYSKEEITTMKAVVKTDEKLIAASKRLSKEFGRSEGSIYVKLLSLSGRMGKKTITKPKSQDIGIKLSTGFVFDFKPQRAEMFKDHVRIYF